MCGLLIFAIVQLRKQPHSWQMWRLLFFSIMLLFGASTHSIVKYRPMHTMPYLGYQTWVNVVGIIGIVGVLSDTLVKRMNAKYGFFSLCVVWAYLFYIGFSVRHALGVYSGTILLSEYPDPGQNLYELLSGPMPFNDTGIFSKLWNEFQGVMGWHDG